jgi:DNA ligase (NAD+)
MTAEESKNRIQWLRAEITRHDTAYYGGAPTISDREYDQLYAELQQLEDTYPQFLSLASPSFKVGCEPTGAEFEEIAHSVPMLSVDNVFDESGIMQWHHTVCRTVTEPRYAVEYKLDGMSLALYYNDGLLVSALTRGDGQVGQFVFPQACTIRNLPLQLQPLRTAPRGVFEVRGEVCMKESEFADYQARCAIAGEAVPANPRNAAVGAMRQKDSRLTRQRPLAFIAHSYGVVE